MVNDLADRRPAEKRTAGAQEAECQQPARKLQDVSVDQEVAPGK